MTSRCTARSSGGGGTPTGRLDHPMVDRRNSTRRQLNRLAHLPASQRRTARRGDRSQRRPSVRGRRPVTARAPNRDLHVAGDRHAYVRNGALGTIVAVHHDRRDQANDTLTVDFDGIGRIEIPRSFFDHH